MELDLWQGWYEAIPEYFGYYGAVSEPVDPLERELDSQREAALRGVAPRALDDFAARIQAHVIACLPHEVILEGLSEAESSEADRAVLGGLLSKADVHEHNALEQLVAMLRKLADRARRRDAGVDRRKWGSRRIEVAPDADESVDSALSAFRYDLGLPGSIHETNLIERQMLALALLRRLRAREHCIIVLHVFDGLTFAAIGAMLACTEGVARVDFHRGVARMRGWLGDEFDEPTLELA